MRLRQRHRHAAEKGRGAQEVEHDLRRPVQHRSGLRIGIGAVTHVLLVGRWREKDRGKRNDHRHFQEPERPHGLPPAEHRDDRLEDRRPHRTGEIGAARDQRERRAASPIEPAAHIDVERRIDPAIAEKADEQPVADVKLPWRTERGNREADADHHRAEHHRPPHADAVGDAAHHEPPEADAEPTQRSRERRGRARTAELGGDRLQGHHGDPRCAERKPHGDERDARHHPGLPGLDRRPDHAFPARPRLLASGNGARTIERGPDRSNAKAQPQSRVWGGPDAPS